ncbi:MAG: sulfatase-like hydrolase/transferase, partial [Gemmatimonadetes bacterium]|nr:sulfatase-like hydrolase/transferase [Gemmatimonadota bacterium]
MYARVIGRRALRRDGSGFLWGPAGLVVALLLGGCGDASVEPPAQALPNIIYMLADDLGYGELGSFGQEKILTPNLDRLAEEGIRFTQHYSGSPVCAPSRGTLMTGLHTGHSQIRDNF